MSQTVFVLKQVVEHAAQLLHAAGIEDSRREARRLLCSVLGCDTATLLIRDQLIAAEVTSFLEKVERRRAREPFAFIEAYAEFWNLRFEVAPTTLIPRADSETLIELLLEHVPSRKVPLRILDLGTGTGCLLLSALTEYPEAFGVGVDRSEGAAQLAKRNAQNLGLSGRASFMVGNWADALSGEFDVVLMNPPYIRRLDIDTLMPEVRLFEPLQALDGGDDGLDAYRMIFAQIGTRLSTIGMIITEIGFDQEEEVKQIASNLFFTNVGQRSDLGKIIRALAFQPQK